MADPLFRNLVPGQIQIGNLVAGTGTNIFIETFDDKAYDVNNQDYQVSMADEKRFGFDQLSPTTIEIKFNVLNNKLLPLYEDAIPNFWSDMPKASDLAREWRFDEGRYVWGSMKTLFVCGEDGVSKVIYGRPGSFAAPKPKVGELWRPCLAEFRRADTLAYSVQEYGVELEIGDIPQYLTRTGGDASSWFRILAEGPMTNPVFTIGEHVISFNYTLDEDEVMEISAYPWQRRVVNNRRENLAEYMNGDSNYLDRLKVPVNVEIPVRWTSEEYNTWVPALGNENWNEDITGFFEWTLPATFTEKAGKTIVRFDLINATGPRKFIGSGMLGTTSSVIYSGKKYKTAAQFSSAIIVEPFAGRSAMAIMCNDAMTSGCALEVVSGFGNNWLRLRKVLSPTTLGPVLDEWQNTALLGWAETDRVSIEFDEATDTFIGKLNGVAKVDFADPTHTIPITADYRTQSFIFDLDGNLTTIGTGFRDIIGYDKAVVPSPTGRVVMLWRDAWVTL